MSVVPVTTAVVRKGDIGVYGNYLGIVTPVYTVMVKSRVDGQLMSVNYVEGQLVHKDESLVEIDPRPYQAQVVQMEGQLIRDQALLTNAHIDLERYQFAYKSNAIPEQMLATQVATVHQYEGTVRLDEGQLSNAVVNLIYTHIAAPISGRVGLRLVDPGNIVHATDTNPLAVIAQLQPITVVFSVSEDDLPEILQQLSQGKKLAVEAYDRVFEKKLATGTLLTLDNQIDTGTGTLKLKALFPNEDNSLFPNQFVNAKLLVRTEHGVLLVPTAAVQRSPEGTFVYVVQTNQTVAMRVVTLGPTEGDTTAVGGVEAGEIIAADNFNRLLDGMKVAVGKPEEAPGDHPVQASLGNGAKVATSDPEERPKPGHGKKRKMAATEATPP
jgi:multidrug efflux system membrane fusion protein